MPVGLLLSTIPVRLARKLMKDDRSKSRPKADDMMQLTREWAVMLAGGMALPLTKFSILS